MRDMRYEQRDTNIYDAIIIGAGPAGLTAAIYTSRARLNALIIEEPSIMSQAAYADIIENFPGFPEGIRGPELVMKMKTQATSLGSKVITGKVEALGFINQDNQDIWQVKSTDKTYQALSIIVASGASERRLGVTGENKFIGKGVSYCAICDGAFFRDKEIVVVGGGNSAVEEAIFLTRFAKKVTIIHRRDRLRATKLLQDQALSNQKIDVAWNSVVDEVLGDDRVSGLRLRDVNTDKLNNIECEGVFVSIGKVPNTSFLKDTVVLNESGYVITGVELETSKKGIFAGGDCRETGLRQIITACGDGALAATGSQHYVDAIKGTLYN